MTFENKAKQKAEILTNDVYINMDGQLAEEEYALMLDWRGQVAEATGGTPNISVKSTMTP